ncbi:MAG: cell division protein FtsZ [Flavobacteriaceae bacterium]
MNTENQFENLSFILPKNQSNVIKVIGIGGGGSNAINHMYNKGINGVDYVICNTDSQALENSPVPNKVQLGIKETEGLGAGADPLIGEKAAIESLNEMRTLLEKNTKMVFITAGMGGGTGTGAAPIISKLAMEMDILTVGIVTMPFVFEGKIRMNHANKGLEKLRSNVDSLIVVNNNKLRDIYGNLGVKEGFSKADEVLATAAKGIAEVITHHYTQNIDLKDAKTVLSKSGNAIMGSYSSSGDKRALNAVSNALDSPLLNDNRIDGAQNVLLLIVSGSNEVTIDEIGIINDYIQEKAGNNANIIMGIGDDQSLAEEITVTVIATGFDMKQQDEILHIEPKKTIYNLDDESEITENFKEDKTELQFDFSSEEIDFKNIDFNVEEIKNNIIKTNEEIKNIDIEFESVFPSDELIDEKIDVLDYDTINNIEVKNPELVKINEELVFDFPSNDNNIDKVVHILEEDVNEIEVIDPIQIIPYTIVEENNSVHVADEIHDKNNIEYKSELNPLNSPIVDGLAKRTEERKIKLKQFNYKFVKPRKVEDMEKEPAYKRAGIELDSNIENSISTSSLVEDDEGNLNLKSKNSFLHDNVD